MKGLFWSISLLICTGIMVGIPVALQRFMGIGVLDSIIMTAIIYVVSLISLVILVHFDTKHYDKVKKNIDKDQKL